MAVEGYTSEFSDLKDNALSIDLPAFTNIIGSETPYCQIIGIHNQNQAFLKGASMQMLVPIHRESQVIGVVLLESLIGDPASNEVMSFLSRLSDHAAIAIANAQLYAEVQSANLAKSEFVSFVSHELKTPMTSIKGFSDLLSSGVVGPINEAQSNFLGTIRSNVERMATLV